MSKGFTLIELMVIIAIITVGLLVIVANIPSKPERIGKTEFRQIK